MSFSARLKTQVVICFTHNGVNDNTMSITSAIVQLQTQMLRTPNLQLKCESNSPNSNDKKVTIIVEVLNQLTRPIITAGFL